ncbi:MAG TPA: ADP-ribosylglycohydrolase family protein [Paracoccaceae bacterium]|nr:ADP-ribosylglycohydrolase family protein [Paracoccaceae bacterium]
MVGRAERAEGALAGLAVGDALGAPAQTLPAAEIAARWGRIEGFVAPDAAHPVAHGLVPGQVTDDTEQALLLAARLIADAPGFDARAWGRDLLAWEAGVRARGLSDLLGPSTRRALEALAAGADPGETGLGGDTNGAAMRVAPVGIAVAPEPLGRLVARVRETARITHDAGPGLAAACAVAAAVSAGVGGAGWAEAATLGEAAAREGAAAAGAPGGDVAERIAAARALAREGGAARVAEIGVSVKARESVPAAFGFVEAAAGDPWAACLHAANAGDDTDTMAAIAGAMTGACAGIGALPRAPLATVVEVNGLDLAAVVAALLALRGSA